MRASSFKLEVLIAGLLLAGFIGLVGVPGSREAWRARERRIVYEEVVRKLRIPHRDEQGYWVGDIAELHRLGQIPREVAEADTAPLNPLAPAPVPFHGYFVRAMTSGPSLTAGDDTPEPFVGRKRAPDNFAICVYPAEPGPRKSAWILSRLSELRRDDGRPPAGFAFPSLKERQAFWSIVD